MPELPEVEAYRVLAERVIGRRVVDVVAPDPWYLKRGIRPDDVRAALLGRAVAAARRRGKLLLLDVGGTGRTLGLRFGMTGRLVVDGVAGVESLLYSSDAAEPAWDRFALRFRTGSLVVRDPRRLGGVELDPDEGRLGPDAATVGAPELRRALAGGAAPLKARLLDQSRLAGIGNLIADEVLWRSGLSPLRPSDSLSAAEIRRLHRHLVRTLADLTERGGSHLGDLMDERRPGGVCPRDGGALVRSTVGGRTSWWCPVHQVG